jgi:hypothetical protein
VVQGDKHKTKPIFTVNFFGLILFLNVNEILILYCDNTV